MRYWVGMVDEGMLIQEYTVRMPSFRTCAKIESEPRRSFKCEIMLSNESRWEHAEP